MGDLPDVLTIQLDPYYTAPLWPDAISLAALQARALPRGGRQQRARPRRGGGAEPAGARRRIPKAQVRDLAPIGDAARRRRTSSSPLRKHDCPPISDGCRGDRARRAATCAKKSGTQPAWIRGIDHRIEAHALGVARSHASRRRRSSPARRPGVGRGTVDVAELHAPFTHQELILRDALGLGADVERQPVGRRARGEPHDGRRA